jgi:hypothetical protein
MGGLAGLVKFFLFLNGVTWNIFLVLKRDAHIDARRAAYNGESFVHRLGTPEKHGHRGRMRKRRSVICNAMHILRPTVNLFLVRRWRGRVRACCQHLPVRPRQGTPDHPSHARRRRFQDQSCKLSPQSFVIRANIINHFGQPSVALPKVPVDKRFCKMNDKPCTVDVSIYL